MRRAILSLSLAIALLPFGARVAAHDIPADVLVQLFVKPDGDRLHVLVRVPLAAMRDVEFPLHGEGFLNFPVPERLLEDAVHVWLTPFLAFSEDDRRLEPPAIVAVRVSLPSDRSFASYDSALAHLARAPLSQATELIWNHAFLDVHLEYRIRSDRSRLSVEPVLARLGVREVTALTLLPPGGAPARAFEFVGDPGLVRLDPRWSQAAAQFARLGFDHILSGTDHLLFLFCLVIPIRRLRPLIGIVTAFTVAHSITLIASAFDLAPGGLWFPPLIETLIAASIVYMALENIVIGDRPAPIARRWIVAFGFGLVHGFGFSFALRETLQFAGSHLLTSLLSFNVGIELGQILVLLLFIPALELLFRVVMPGRVGVIVLSALAAHTAWHWTADRFDRLRRFNPPAIDAAAAAVLLRWLAVAVGVAAAAWLWRRRAHGRGTPSGPGR